MSHPDPKDHLIGLLLETLRTCRTIITANAEYADTTARTMEACAQTKTEEDQWDAERKRSNALYGGIIANLNTVISEGEAAI